MNKQKMTPTERKAYNDIKAYVILSFVLLGILIWITYDTVRSILG